MDSTAAIGTRPDPRCHVGKYAGQPSTDRPVPHLARTALSDRDNWSDESRCPLWLLLTTRETAQQAGLNGVRDPHFYLRLLRRWLWMIILLPVIAGATAGVIAQRLPRSYEAKSIALVSVPDFPAGASQDSLGALLDQRVQTYVGLINTGPVQRLLVSDGIPRSTQELAGHLRAAREPGSTLIDISFSDHDPAVALRVALDIIPAVNRSIAGVPATLQLNELTQWEVPQSEPTAPVGPNPLLVAALAAAVGAGLAVNMALAFDLVYELGPQSQDQPLEPLSTAKSEAEVPA